MSVDISAYVSGIVAAIFNPSSVTVKNSPSGPEAVQQAMNELNGLQEKEFEAVLGLPDIVKDTESDFFNDPKVIIPLNEVPYDGVNRLVFDLPQGPEDEFADLNRLKDALGVDSLKDLKDESVPVGFIGGNEAILWDELIDMTPEKQAEGSKEKPAPQGDVPDEIVTEGETPDHDHNAGEFDGVASDGSKTENSDPESQSADGSDDKAETGDAGSDEAAAEGSSEGNSEDNSESASNDDSEDSVNVEETTVSPSGGDTASSNEGTS